MQSTPSFFSTSGLARASARRPWLVVAGWVLALVLAVGAMGILGDATTTEVTFLDNPESMRGNDLLVFRPQVPVRRAPQAVGLAQGAARGGGPPIATPGRAGRRCARSTGCRRTRKATPR